MAVKEIIYLTVKHAICDGDNESTCSYFKGYLECPKKRIAIHKTVYAVSRLMQRDDPKVDFGYYWGVCGPFSEYVRAKIIEWIIPGLEGNEDELKEKMPTQDADSDQKLPLKAYYERLSINTDGRKLFSKVKRFFAWPEEDGDYSYLYYELLASALDLYTTGDTKEILYGRLRALKPADGPEDALIHRITEAFFERKSSFIEENEENRQYEEKVLVT